MLILESFQAGLSWECVLNKRESFRTEYEGFDIDKVCEFGAEKVTELLNNKGIIRNKLKINAYITYYGNDDIKLKMFMVVEEKLMLLVLLI